MISEDIVGEITSQLVQSDKNKEKVLELSRQLQKSKLNSMIASIDICVASRSMEIEFKIDCPVMIISWNSRGFRFRFNDNSLQWCRIRSTLGELWMRIEAKILDTI